MQIQIIKVTGKSAYNLKNFVEDANWIIQNGTYSSKLSGYYHYMGIVTLTQDYLGGIENNVLEAVYNEEGRAFNNTGTFRYEYALRDHLGNTRVVFTHKNASGSIDNTEILGETH